MTNDVKLSDFAFYGGLEHKIAIWFFFAEARYISLEFNCRKVCQYRDNLNEMKCNQVSDAVWKHREFIQISQNVTRQLVLTINQQKNKVKFNTYKLRSHVVLRTSKELYYYNNRIYIKTSGFTSCMEPCLLGKLPTVKIKWKNGLSFDIQDYISLQAFGFLFFVFYCFCLCLFVCSFFREMSYNHLVFQTCSLTKLTPV